MSSLAIQTESIDHLGLVCGMLDEISLVSVIDSLLPSKGDGAVISYGEAVKAMILNGLGFVDRPLYLTPDYFEKKAVSHLFNRDITSAAFNDDTLGRTLDALYEYGVSDLYESVASEALHTLEITPSHFHLDSTSFHVDGEYNSAESESKDGVVHIIPGYSRDHHPNLNQVVLNLIVENQSGIPLLLKVADGNQIDSNAFPKIVKEYILALKQSSESPFLTGDSALYNKESLKVFRENKISFLSRVPLTIKEAKLLQKNAPSMEFTPIDDNYGYAVKEVVYEEIPQQWILFRSRAATKRESKTLVKRIARESEKETKDFKKLQRQRFACEADAQNALDTFSGKTKWIEIQNKQILSIKKYGKRGKTAPDEKPKSIEYSVIGAAVLPLTTMKNKEQEESGYFILATDKKELTPEDVLRQYKEQQRVERGFRFLKSPDFLTNSLYLKKPERIEALLMIMTLSLMVYSALEYKTRKNLKEQDESIKDQKGKPTKRPTCRWIFQCFSEIQIVVIEQMGVKQIANLSQENEKLLNILGEPFWRYYRANW